MKLVEGVGRKYALFEVCGRQRTVDFDSELYRITEMVRCSGCKRCVVECRLPPMRGACCKAIVKKKVNVEKTILTEFMCRACPEYIELDSKVRVGRREEGMCVICKEELAGKIVKAHPTLHHTMVWCMSVVSIQRSMIWVKRKV